MKTRLTWRLPILALSAVGFAYKQHVFLVSLLPHTLHGLEADECEACSLPLASNLLPGVERTPGTHRSGSNPSGTQPPGKPPTDALAADFDLANLSIPRKEIVTLLNPDSIPALTNPKTEPAGKAHWLPDDARVIEVESGGEVLGVPLRVLNWHEIVNTTLGGAPIAITYCPLCDSATVFSRLVTPKGRSADSTAGGEADPTPLVLEFGVSGSLYKSNVLMYDRTHRGLWSQLGMRAVSGPLSGTALDMLPVNVVSFAAFKQAHPGAPVVSKDTGHNRDYLRSPYESYFKTDNLMVPVKGVGEALPGKTLGVGVAVGSGEAAQAWFVSQEVIGESFTLQTPAGKVTMSSNAAGVQIVEAPQVSDVRTAQTFYFSWSAFYPETTVIAARHEAGAAEGTAVQAPGLSIGERAPDVALTTVDGEPVRLSTLYEAGPVIVTFYRGGWCPFCNRALADWQSRMEEVKSAGGTFVALTPEKPDRAAATIESNDITYLVLSDAAHEAAKAFKVHFTVDEQTRSEYIKFGLDVGAANSSGTWELPAPATFVIDRSGVIRYAFADWDYQKRADPDEVIGVLRGLEEGR